MIFSLPLAVKARWFPSGGRPTGTARTEPRPPRNAGGQLPTPSPSAVSARCRSAGAWFFRIVGAVSGSVLRCRPAVSAALEISAGCADFAVHGRAGGALRLLRCFESARPFSLGPDTASFRGSACRRATLQPPAASCLSFAGFSRFGAVLPGSVTVQHTFCPGRAAFPSAARRCGGGVLPLSAQPFTRPGKTLYNK